MGTMVSYDNEPSASKIKQKSFEFNQRNLKFSRKIWKRLIDSKFQQKLLMYLNVLFENLTSAYITKFTIIISLK